MHTTVFSDNIFTGFKQYCEIIVNIFFLSLCLFLSVVERGIWLDPTKRPYYCQVYSTDDIYTEWVILFGKCE